MITNQEKRYKLYSLIRQIRKNAGLRQIDIATKLNLPQSFVSKYESGERRLDLIELESICLAVGISLKEFICLYEEITSESP